LGAAIVLLQIGTGACDSNNLPAPVFSSVVDTAVVYALTGTEIGTASAFDLLTALPARPELDDFYDIAFDIDSGGNPTLYPAALVGLPSSAGIQQSTSAFDDILRAPLDDYVTDTALVIEAGTVFIARSRTTNQGCSAFIGAIPRYGKFEVIGLDPTARTVTLKHLVNLNCGYRDLTPGIPAQ
jgi:hypothetical protein